MKIYLAARYNRRAEIDGYRREIEKLGHTVTSRWLNGSHDAGSLTEPTDPELLARFAREDLQDVNAADLVISFTEQGDTPRGGRHVEFGVAYSIGNKVWVVPYRENIFHYLPAVRRFDTFEQVLEALKDP